MSEPIQFAPATTSDAEALADLRVQAMRESLEQAGRFDLERARNRLLASFDAACTQIIERAGMRVGFFVVKPVADGLSLDHLYVLPAFQRCGIGAAVLAQVFAEAEADARTCNVVVGALRGSPANAFYQRNGFTLQRSEEFDHYYLRQPKSARPAT